MNQSEIIESLEGYKAELDAILGRFRETYNGWHIDSNDSGRFSEIVHQVRDIFDDHVSNGGLYSAQLVFYANDSIANFVRSPSYKGVENVRGLVVSVLVRVQRNPFAVLEVAQAARAKGKKDPEFIEQMARRLPIIIRQIRDRREDRSTLDVNDEYDLQDLCRAVLSLHFDDIRREEWTPSYAGSSSRMDFLLPEVEAVVETKMTRLGLNAKKLGEELIIDIARYEKHPLCRTLYCLVYDPEGRVANPRGVESDLEAHSAKITVRVMIVP